MVRSDDEGRYEIYWLTKGWWTVIVTAKGYTDAGFDVQMTLEQETKRHDVMLVPEDTGDGDDEGSSLTFYLAVVLIVASVVIVVYAFTTNRTPKGR